MKILNLVILPQQLENYENFYYNIYMKSKKELNKIANEIVQLEQKIQANLMDKNVQSYSSEIENIMKSLSIEDLLKVIGIVEERLK